MGRKRKDIDRWIPRYVCRGKSAYEYRPTKEKTIRLCGLDAPKTEVIQRYAVEFERYNCGQGTISELVEKYFNGIRYANLSARTQDDYTKYWEKLKPVFGHLNFNKLQPGHVTEYMEIKGRTAPVQANRHLSFLKTIYKWAHNRSLVATNPVLTIERFTEKARDRYIEDAEYYATYNAAKTGIRVAMEISYLCAARQGDIRLLTKRDILKEGIFIKQAKTGKKQIKAWTPRLLAAIELAKSIQPKNGSIYIIPTRTGAPYTTNGFCSMWEKALAAGRKASGLPLDFTFHDIKAKSISDYDGDKQAFSGHKTASQVGIYDRKTAVVETLNLPAISSSGDASV